MAEPPIIATTPATGATKPDLNGMTSIDDKVFLECEMLAYAAVGEIAVKVADEATGAIPAVGDGQNQTPLVVLLDEELMSAFRLFASLKLQLSLFEKGFAGVAPAAAVQPWAMKLAVGPALAIAGVTGAVEGVVDLLGLFRQDTQFFGRPVAIRETALYVEVAHAFREKGWEVVYPRLLSYQASLRAQPSQVTLTTLFDGVFSARQQAADRLRPLLQQVADLEQQLLDRRREFAGADAERQKVLTIELQDLQAQLVDARKNLDPDLVLFENTDAQWNALQTGLARADEKSGQVPMQLIVRAADVLAMFLNSSRAYFCYANAAVAGGTMRIKRNLWRTMFRGDALEFSGGAVVSYTLFDGNARILTARTHRHMTDFRGFSEKTPVWTNLNT